MSFVLEQLAPKLDFCQKMKFPKCLTMMKFQNFKMKTQQVSCFKSPFELNLLLNLSYIL